MKLSFAQLACTFSLACLLMPNMAQASSSVSFTIDGVISDNKLGYTTGQNVTFTFLLREYQPETLRVSPNPPYQQSACCSGKFSWDQDNTAQAHLWDDVYGTGLSGDWNLTSSSNLIQSHLGLTLGHGASQTFEISAWDFGGTLANTGVFANGFKVTGFQVFTVYLGLDALAVYGDNLFSAPVPDPSNLFSGLFGTYFPDPIFTNTARLDGLGPNGGSVVNFKVNSLTIGPTVVPIPAAGWLMGSALAGVFAGVKRKTKS